MHTVDLNHFLFPISLPSARKGTRRARLKPLATSRIVGRSMVRCIWDRPQIMPTSSSPLLKNAPLLDDITLTCLSSGLFLMSSCEFSLPLQKPQLQIAPVGQARHTPWLLASSQSLGRADPDLRLEWSIFLDCDAMALSSYELSDTGRTRDALQPSNTANLRGLGDSNPCSSLNDALFEALRRHNCRVQGWIALCSTFLCL